MHTQLSSGTKGLNFGLSHLNASFACKNRKGFDKIAWMRGFVLAVCINWLI